MPEHFAIMNLWVVFVTFSVIFYIQQAAGVKKRPEAKYTHSIHTWIAVLLKYSYT